MGVGMTTSEIHVDPSIGEVFELLHRMESCRTLEPFQWMAREAIQKLRDYERRIAASNVKAGHA
jgi:hypothetical protein